MKQCLSEIEGRLAGRKAWTEGALRRFSVATTALLCLLASRDAACQVGKALQEAISGSQTTAGDAAASAQPEASIEESIAKLQEKQARAEERLRNAEEAEKSDADVQYGVSSAEFQERTRLLRNLARTYTKHIDLLRKLAETRQSQQELGAEMEAFQGFKEPPPYTVDFVDGFRAEAYGKDLEIKSYQVELDLIEKSIQGTRAELGKAEEALRALSEKTVEAGQGLGAIRAQWLYETEQVRAQCLNATLAQAESQKSVREAQLALQRQELDFVTLKLRMASAHVRFEQSELDVKLSDIEAKRGELDKELAAADKAQAKADETLASAREALQKAQASPVPEAPEAAAERERELRGLQLAVETRLAEVETARWVVQELRLFLDTRSTEVAIWRQRFDVYHSEDVNELNAAREFIAARLSLLEQWTPLIDSNLQDTHALIAGQQKRLADWKTEDGDKKLGERVLTTYMERDSVFRRGRTRVAEMEQLLRSWQAEIEERRATIPLSERAKSFVEAAYALVDRVWNFTLFNVNETTVIVDGKPVTRTEAVTVSKIVLALIILCVGIFVARKVARRIHHVTTERFKAEESVAVPIEKALFYVMVVIIVLLALKTVRIPVTIFAYLGGAIAIGIGFGAQNLINNFISGLIMLLERPIKVGDIVELDGVRGRVVNIGSRCSQVKRFDGIDILVPNSAFLEKNVTNWTLSDPVVRFSVSVGVAYGSPTREVSTLIERAVTEHGKVLKRPEPVVVFEDFGDSALVFSVYFWLELTTMMDQRVVCSDIRFRIDKLFREAGISIAFPQRDLHIDSIRPVQVEIVPGDGKQDDAE